MIRHLVMWKLDDSYPPDEKERLKLEFTNRLRDLSGKIQELRSLDVFLNDAQAPQSNYDILLDTTFNTFKDLETYQVNPYHKKVGEFIKSIKLQRVCIDYGC